MFQRDTVELLCVNLMFTRVIITKGTHWREVRKGEDKLFFNHRHNTKYYPVYSTC